MRKPLIDSYVRRNAIAVVLCVVILLTGLGFWGWLHYGNDFGHYEEIARFEINADGTKVVVISWGDEDINSDDLVYDVYSNRKPEINQKSFGTCFGVIDGRFKREELKFDILKSNNDNVIGIVERLNPDVLLILHDFDTGFSYPGIRELGIALSEKDAASLSACMNSLRTIFPLIEFKLLSEVYPKEASRLRVWP